MPDAQTIYEPPPATYLEMLSMPHQYLATVEYALDGQVRDTVAEVAFDAPFSTAATLNRQDLEAMRGRLEPLHDWLRQVAFRPLVDQGRVVADSIQVVGLVRLG